jgi:hypothetical protein
VEHRDDLLDQLVPAPWTARRRALATAAAVLLVAIGGLGWWGGFLGPNVRPSTGWSSAPSSDGESVEVGIEFHNRGLLELRDVTLELSGLPRATVVADPVADRIPGGGTATATVTIVVDECDDRPSVEDATIHVRARSGIVTTSRPLVRAGDPASPFAPGPSDVAAVLEPICGTR